MKLDNIDLSRLDIEQIPKFDKCPCELCDDGCFDRAGHRHHPECRRKGLKKSNLSLNLRCPLTHYQSTFLSAVSPSGHGEDHRRQPCPPPADNEIPTSFRNVPMQSLSSQREHFQPPPRGALKRNVDVQTKQVRRFLSSFCFWFYLKSFRFSSIISLSNKRFQWTQKLNIKLNTLKNQSFLLNFVH